MRWRTGGMLVRLIMVNLAVFLLLRAFGIIAFLGDIPWLNPVSSGYYFLATTSNPSVLITRPWSILTHMFTHYGLLHIAFNMIFLWFLGRLFQEYFGARKLLATYLLGGLAGFVTYFAAYNLLPGFHGATSTALGASAAVMAIFVGTATYLPNMEIRLILIGAVKLKYVAVVYVLLDFLALSGSSNVGGSIGHLGGAAYGFALMYQMRKGRDIGEWFERLLDKVVNLGKGSSNLKVKYKSTKKKKQKTYKTDEDFNAEKKARQERIDQILDKISKSGYDSLTKDEKDYLFRHSKDL